jgi:hypothetical protein
MCHCSENPGENPEMHTKMLDFTGFDNVLSLSTIDCDLISASSCAYNL